MNAESSNEHGWTPLHVAATALLTILPGLLLSAPVSASTCENPDNETSVQGSHHCLVIGTTAAKERTDTLVVMLHGDQSRGGPVDYVFRIAKRFAGPRVTAVGMVRPGYPAGDRKSSGRSTRSLPRDAKYRLKEIDSIGAAVAVLKSHHEARQLVLVGHSGGAVIAGVLLGRQPDLVDAVVLIACPCDIPRWRNARGRRPMPFAQSPHKWLGKARADARIVAITGANDRNTLPEIARGYVAEAKKLGLDAEFILVPDAGHSLRRSFRAPVSDAVDKLVGR